MSREKERKRVMLCCSKKSTKPAVSAARSLFYSHPLFPGTFVTLFAFLNPFGNMVALDPFSLFSIRNRTNCLRTLLRWNRSKSKVETYLDLSNSLEGVEKKEEKLADLRSSNCSIPPNRGRCWSRIDRITRSRVHDERNVTRRRRQLEREQMEKLDAVRDTNTLRVYSRLWLCFRDWVERESIVGVSRDSELPLPPSIVPTPVSRQPACSSTRSFPLGSRPHPSHKDVPHYRKHRHPSRWSAARSRLYARSRIQSNSSTRVTTSSASPRNHMRPRKYKRRTMPFRTRRSFPSFSWSKKKNMIGNRDEKSPIKPWTSDRAFVLFIRTVQNWVRFFSRETV